jgi:cytochrome c oxidase subunit 3
MSANTAVAISEPRRSRSTGGSPPNGDGDGNFAGGLDIPRRAYITGTAIALAGILMFFAALISASVVRKGSPSGDWRSLAIPPILWLNTTILLTSSFALAHARSRFIIRDQRGFRHWCQITAILGGFFMVGQSFAWRQLASAGVYLATNPASSFFYTLTAAHTLHVAAGLIALLCILFDKPRRIPFKTAIDVVSLYWHFMDAVWIFLFIFLLNA